MKPSRNINRNRSKREIRKRALIVTEGIKTEVMYVQSLVQYLNATGVKVQSPKTKGIGKDPLNVLREADGIRRADTEGFDSTWILVDVDEHATLKDCLDEAQELGIHVIVSNPSFEVWLLWHFEDMNKHCTNKDLRDRLKSLGHEGKAVARKFPYENYVDAVARANSGGRKVASCQKGSNPSSAMPVLLDSWK